jgi:hypothetical protein
MGLLLLLRGAAVALLAGSEPQMGPGRQARLLSRLRPANATSTDPPPTWITRNPLRDLKPLPKVHYNNEGIDGSYITETGHGPSSGASLQMMVDYARITGSFPALLDGDCAASNPPVACD